MMTTKEGGIMKAKYIGLCLIIVGMVLACSEEEVIKVESTEQSLEIYVRAYNGNNEVPSTRLAYTDSETEGKGVIVTWSANDAFYLEGEVDENNICASGDMKILEKEEYGKTEEFKGTLNRTLTEGEHITGYYPLDAYETVNDCFKVDVRKATQVKSNPMAHLSCTNYMVGKGNVDDNRIVTVDFTGGNKVAIVRFDITLPGMTDEVSIQELQIESENLHTVGTLDALTDEFIESALLEKHRQIVYLDGYTAGTSETKLQVYATVMPTSLNKDMTLKVLLGNGNVYSSIVSFSTEASVVACNRYYIIKEVVPLIELDYTWYTSLGANASNYEIGTEGQLFAFANIVNGTAPSIVKNDFSGQTITLVNDIILNTDWIPIGSSDMNGKSHSYFKGVFDGDFHIVSNLNLYVEAPEFDSASRYFRYGFFGNVEGATIKNLTIQGDALMERTVEHNQGAFHFGGLVGHAENTNIENCRNELSLTGYNLYDLKIGGLVGLLKDGQVKLCSNAGNIIAVGAKGRPYLGGIIGYGETNEIVACYTEDVLLEIRKSGKISQLGGIAGQLAYGNKLIASYSLVDEISSDATSNDSEIGGLVGTIGSQGSSSYIYGCYAVTKLWGYEWSSNENNVNVGSDLNSETYMKTLNEGIAMWNATLSGITNSAYCRYSYVKGDTHLILKETNSNNSGQLDDMGNGGEIGK